MNSYSDTYITINKENLRNNARFFIEKSGKKLIAVIKSNAYGHSIIHCAKILEDIADVFAVASLDEALLLRNNDIKLPILILNPLNIGFVQDAYDNDMIITVSTEDYLNSLMQKYKDIIHNLKIQIKIDSGMNRFGVKTIDEYKAMLEIIRNNELFDLIGVYTHFHSANDMEQSNKQISVFRQIFNSEYYPYKYIHICSTGAVLNNLDIPETTHVRVGLGLYGLCEDINVKEVLSLYTKIVQVKEVKKDETVGYGARHKADENEYIGILPLGYSDGILRANTGRFVYVDGNLCEIIGNVCMNSMMIKLPNKDIKKEAEIIGPHVSAKTIAGHIGTIPYEVVTSLLNDIKRIVI